MTSRLKKFIVERHHIHDVQLLRCMVVHVIVIQHEIIHNMDKICQFKYGPLYSHYKYVINHKYFIEYFLINHKYSIGYFFLLSTQKSCYLYNFIVFKYIVIIHRISSSLHKLYNLV